MGSATLRTLFQALVAALLAVAAVAAAVAIEQGWWSRGLVFLPIERARDGLLRFAAPALALAVLVALAPRLRAAWRGLRPKARVIVLAVAAAAALVLALGRGALLATLGEARWPLQRSLAALGFLPRQESVGRWLLGLALLAALVLAAGVLWPRGRSPRSRLVAPAAVALAALVLAAVPLRRAAARGGERSNVLLVVLDTVGAKHLASYGYARATMPELDQLAGRGILFRSSWSVAPWTLPSHASMFTGLHPLVHHATQEHLALDPGFTTLAEILADQGYRTFAAVNNPVLSPETGMDQGFATYRSMYRRSERERFDAGARHPTSAALAEFLDGLRGDRFFAFLNYIEPHAPYHPPDEIALRFLRDGRDLESARAIDQRWTRYYTGETELSAQDFAALNDLYDAELAQLSRVVADLVAMLEERHLLDDTLVILTSDHGENLGEHGHLDHVFSLGDALLHVPLIVLGEGVPAGAVDGDPAFTTDVFHTVLAAAGAGERLPSGARDLRVPGRGDPERVLLASYDYPLQVLSVLLGEGHRSLDGIARYLRRLRAIRTREWKLVLGSDGSRELYRIAEDAQEANDLAAADPERVATLSGTLFGEISTVVGRRVDAIEPPGPELPDAKGFEALDDEAAEHLRALGYVE